MISTSFNIECDGRGASKLCHGIFTTNPGQCDTVDEALQQVKQYHWQHIGNHDFCPNCALRADREYLAERLNIILHHVCIAFDEDPANMHKKRATASATDARRAFIALAKFYTLAEDSQIGEFVNVRAGNVPRAVFRLGELLQLDQFLNRKYRLAQNEVKKLPL